MSVIVRSCYSFLEYVAQAKNKVLLLSDTKTWSHLLSLHDLATSVSSLMHAFLCAWQPFSSNECLLQNQNIKLLLKHLQIHLATTSCPLAPPHPWLQILLFIHGLLNKCLPLDKPGAPWSLLVPLPKPPVLAIVSLNSSLKAAGKFILSCKNTPRLWISNH